jgi:uncharacterized phiE125 gp8 family phage protein
MSLKLITPPALEPVTLAEAKLHLRVDNATEDALIAALITAAREHAEHVTERAFITQTWELALDAFPCAEIRLPKPALLSIVSVKYDDAAAVEQTLGGSAYTIDTHAQPGWLLPAYNTTWPTTLAAANALRIRYTAGYGAAASAVPAGIKAWMLLRLGNLYRNREELVDGRMVQPSFVDRLLDPYRVWVL